MRTAKLRTGIQYHQDFLPDHRELFSDVLEQFYSLEPVPVKLGGSRIAAMSVSTDRQNRFTDVSGASGGSSQKLARVLWRPMTGFLAGRVAAITKVMPTVAAFNFYPDGDSFLDFHSDYDSQIGPHVDDVVVATISFGVERLLQMRRIDGSDEFSRLLEPGSLFVMRGKVQREWLHGIPKTDAFGGRLSITFLCPQLDPKEKCSWVLSKVTEEMLNLTNLSNHRVLTEYEGKVPTPVFVGTREEVFAKWCLRDEEEALAMTNPGDTDQVYETPQRMVDAHPYLREHIPEKSNFQPSNKETPESEMPNPHSVPMGDYPTDWLKDMVGLAQAEIGRREADSG